MHTKPRVTLLKQSNVLWDFFQQEQLISVGKKNMISHRVICQCTGTDISVPVKSITGVLSPNWSGLACGFLSRLTGGFPSIFAVSSFDWGACSKVQRRLIDFPRLGSGPCKEERHLLRHPPQFQQRQVSAARQPPPGPEGNAHWNHSFFPSGWKGNKRQQSKKMLVFKYSRNWEPDNNSATTESIQPSGDGDMSKRGGGGKKRRLWRKESP